MFNFYGLLAHWAFSVVLLSCMSHVFAATVIHRAVEPAQVMLDVTQSNKQLTLYLSIPTLLVDDTTLQAFTELPISHWNINETARCSLQNKRLFVQEAAQKGNESIQVVYEFECLAPEFLQQIEAQLQTLLPTLKQINTWVSTAYWQNKQVVKVPQTIIYLKAGL